jgi:hypothetical protein
MPFKSYRAAEPPGTVDTFTARGDAVITHSPEQARGYREAAERAARQGPSSVRQVTAAPEAAPLPSPQVARQILGKEISRLACQAESLRRQASGNPLAFAGNANPYLTQVDQAGAGMREQAAGELARVRAELARLEAVMADDHQVTTWAADFMATHPGPIRIS